MIVSKKIELINGNLLDFPNGINNIAHSCNCRMIMGGGIAKQIKDRYPEAYQADVDFISDEYDHNGQFKHPLGNYSKAKVDKGVIYNLYTQAGIGTGERQVHYEKFWRALKNMQEDLLFIQHETGIRQSLGLPYGISCGLAGGNWGIINAMIEDIFLDSLLKCCIVKYDE